MIAALALSLSLGAAGNHTGTGSVTYITAKEAYLDVGSHDGLAVGAQAKITRRGRQIGTCEVVEAADDTGRCKSDRASIGDHVVFTTAAPPPPAPTAAPKTYTTATLPPKKSDADLAALRGIVTAVPVEKVVHKQDAGPLDISTHATASLKEEVWVLSAAAAGGFGRTVLDANVRTHIAPLGLPMFASGGMRVVGDLIAPQTQRTRPNEPVELYVWNASAGVDGQNVVGEIGRFLPRKAPGVILLDGVQAGARFGEIEFGVYGGAIPDLLTIYPAFNQLTGGVYGGWDLEAAPGVMIAPRARAAVVTSSDGATKRGEVEAETGVWWKEVGSFGASARVVSAEAPAFIPTLDGARVDAELTALAPWKLDFGYRWLSNPAIDFDAEGGFIGTINATHHADLSASYEVIPGLILGATSGLTYDVRDDYLRGWIGPDIGVPHAFGDWGGLDIGYLEELGNTPGRSGYVSAQIDPIAELHITARASYLEDSAAPGDAYRETGLMTIVGAPILPWLTVEGRIYVTQALASADGDPRAAPSLLAADLGVTGSL